MFDEMRDDIIKKYGFEANETITFCVLCDLIENDLMPENEKFSAVKMYNALMEG